MPELESSDGSTPRGGQEEVLNPDQECVSVDAGAGTGKTTDDAVADRRYAYSG